MAAPRVRVIVVNHNGGAHLARCLAALAAQTVADFEAVVVDNASTDGSMAAMDGCDARFRALPLDANLGFAAANNRAAAGAQTPWLATLNPDAFAEPDWLARLLAAAEAHPDVAMFGSTQLDAADPARFDGTGDAYFFAGFPWRGNHGRAAGPLPDLAGTFAPCAAAALWRRDAFARAGGFDARFFCYCEDIDLGFRLRLQGARCLQVGGARVAHVGWGSTGGRGAFSLYHGTRNRVWTMVKDLPGPLLALALPAHLAGLAGLFARMAARREPWAHWRAVVRGLGDALAGLGPVWRERRRIQGARTVPWWRLARALCWAPWRIALRLPDLRAP
jgi:N-acetylglucosaminyl-diphospho-decaprenol L-rhamnosyltransferase